MAPDARPTLAVWKFASCDGCQLTLLDCEDQLLPLADRVHIAHFLEMSRAEGGAGEPAPLEGAGPYDLSLVEGSITTAGDAERIRHIRRISRRLVTIGACATAGGIQALRNFADVEEFRAAVYAHPEYIATLDTSTPIAAHVPVDFELRGCPIDRGQLIEVITAYLAGRRPNIPRHSVCFSCKQRGNTCVTVAYGTPCLGPVTHAGCGALCPTYGRGCYGCFGPSAAPNMPSMVGQLRHDGMDERDVVRFVRTFNAASPEYAPVPGLVGIAERRRDGAADHTSVQAPPGAPAVDPAPAAPGSPSPGPLPGRPVADERPAQDPPPGNPTSEGPR